MKKNIEFNCVLPNGIHARPANHLEKVCASFQSNIKLINLRNRLEGSAKSVLALVGTDTLMNDVCCLEIEGEDAQAAFERLSVYIQDEFPYCDEALDVLDEAEVCLPQSLMRLTPQLCIGKRLSQGIAKGQLVRYQTAELSDFLNALSQKDLNETKQAVYARLTDQAETATGQEKAIIEAHLAILQDDTFIQPIQTGIAQGLTFAKAVIQTVEAISATLMQSTSDYLKERVLDIKDIAMQLLIEAHPEMNLTTDVHLTHDAIVFANDLTPSQFLGLDRRYLKGLILTQAGSTSHTVILARAFNIPAVSGVSFEESTLTNDALTYVDGNLGVVAPAPTLSVAKYFERAIWLAHQTQHKEAAFIEKAGLTQDGQSIEIAANIACVAEAAPAFTKGAEGVGLFRTEMLFMDRAIAPDETEQFAAYKQVLEAANGKAVIIRTMDIGGDKPIDYLNLPQEHNPFLGYRAVRIYPEFITLFHTQLRAILRAAQFGYAKVMIPMIQSIEEIRWVKAQLDLVKQDLTQADESFGEIELGIMVEIPSVAFLMDQFCQEVDFFSIGSNDMTQYLLAVDRDNDKVSRLYNSLAPAFLRLLAQVVKGAHAHGKWVGLCGELGANRQVLPLLVGAGLDELSMAAPSIASTKAALSELDSQACQELFEKACQCPTIADVEAMLVEFGQQQADKPLFAEECVLLDSDFSSKEEAIQTLVGNLGVCGRTDKVGKLEADIWAREDVFTTGLGNGFAIPHTKSDNIVHSSISIAKLNQPVRWSDDEESDVDFVIMLTLNKAQGDQHMRIFSGLARKLIHENFRNTLKSMTSAKDAIAFLKSELSL